MELYKKITGNDFKPFSGDVKKRIINNLEKASIL